jgi:transcription-repair coupling factor (superfamily II helicase)
LVYLGYNKVSTVENKGQFSQRGDITDIYPLVGEPIRIEFFGDNIESIRSFNLSTQRSIKKVQEFDIHPRFSVVRSKKDGLKEAIIKKFDHNNLTDPLKETEELYWEGIEYFREFTDQKASGFFQFLPGNCHLIFDEWQDLFTQIDHYLERQVAIYDDAITKSKILPLSEPLYFDSNYIRGYIDKVKQKLYLQTLSEEKEELSYEIKSYPTERFSSKIENFVQYIKESIFKKKTVLIYSEQPQRVLGIMKEWDIPAEYLGSDDDIDTLIKNFSHKKVYIQRDGVEEGFHLVDLDLIVLTDRELFGKSRQAVAKQKKKIDQAAAAKRDAKNIYTDISEIQAGNYVVHYKHGVGIYRGTEMIELDNGNIKAEYLAIEYADEARVLIPVDQVNMLSRFNVNQEVKPRLSKLGGTEWERTKSKVKKSVRKIAQDLINLYALRSKQTGYKYPPDTPWQIEIEDAFPYQETEDQLKSITEIKVDMESEKLMDRLICGDAGFGKTEVILRAVFKVIMEGRQVAILVPTTVLAQQHFDVFSDRYAPYPIRVGLLSRFRTASQQKEVVQKLKIGEVDLVIGTHRLLQKDIQFKDIGLLVIDEEQRFGVAHKEKLKQIRKDLDVVSMSATPIPRTLHMSLSGIRDISLITTAPTNRKPVKTYVGEFKAH